MRKYDEEFKQNAVKKILDGQSAVSVSRESGVAKSLLHKWKRSGGFCYSACLQNKFTRRIIGWKAAERMTAQLVIDSFLQAEDAV